jgi:hypothetical protein
MNSKSRPEALTEILDDLVASEPVIDSQTMARWIQLYPQYENELMDFAARWSVMTHLPPDESPLENEQAFYAGGLEVVKNILHTSRQRIATTEQPISSLLAEAATHDLTIAKLAALSELSVPIIAKFEQRLISFSSIPREAIQNVAQSLQRSFESVAAYLQSPPAFASGASYKTDTAPEMPSQQDFATAIKDDRTLSEEKKARWLDLASRSHKGQ